MAHYTRKNLSKETKHFSNHFFEIIATMSETYVFLYLGLSIFYAMGDYDFFMICFAIVCFTIMVFLFFINTFLFRFYV